MKRLTVALAQSLVVAAFFAVPSFADDEEALKKDLTAVIALHGLPCGRVVAATELAKSDYAASCEDGNKYRVYLNAAWRVVVEQQSKRERMARTLFVLAGCDGQCLCRCVLADVSQEISVGPLT